MPGLTSLLIGSILSSLIGTGVNAAIQASTNSQNVNAAREINAQQQSNLENAHQIEMNDLKQAGLNPVLTATGGSGAPMVSMNTPRANAPQIDLSGVNSALTGMMHMMMMQTLIGEKNAILADRNDISRDRLAAYRNTATHNNALTDAKTEYIRGNLPQATSAIHSAKQLSREWTQKDEDYWNSLLKDLENWHKK